MRFQDKVAIVSGGSGGIGLAVAQRLGAEGARLVLVGRHADTLTPTPSRRQPDAAGRGPRRVGQRGRRGGAFLHQLVGQELTDIS